MISVIILVVLSGASLAQESGQEKTAEANNYQDWSDFWLVHLFINLLGYATIFVPGYWLIRYFRHIKYNETAGPGVCQNLVILCVFGKEPLFNQLEDGESKSSAIASKSEDSPIRGILRLLACFAGLQVSYLTWGVLQERIMTIQYGKTQDEPGEFFKDSQFLVFVNRILAFIIAIAVILVRPQPAHTAPLYKYSFSSFSNIMSSWCQYEALKFVSFPTQVLAKASKVIPVMLMGKLVSKKSYQHHEYVTAILISMGLSMFLLTSGDVTRHRDSVTTTGGLFMLVGYMLFDSFTSNWQDELFHKYKMSSIQMMAGVNLFSCLLTSVSLIEQGSFVESAAFMFRHPEFYIDIVVLSICSAFGQLFIFYTISQYGAVVFVIIMTVRQGFAILLSCLIYNHPVTLVGFLGILFVFAALFLKIYAGHRQKALKRLAAANASQKV